MRIPRAVFWTSAAWTGAFFVTCVLVPLVAVFSRLGLTTVAWGQLTDPAVLAIAKMTAFQAVLSTVISAAFGLPLGLWAARAARGGRLSRVVEALLVLPYGVPTVVAAMAWVAWLGRSGIIADLGVGLGGGALDWAYSLKAVILAHVFLNVPLVALIVAQARLHVPRMQLEAAATLGAGPIAVFRFVTWNHVRWALASASAQVLTLCAMSFALVLILGGGPPVETLETAIYGRIRFGSLDISGAAACALWEMAITLTPWVLVVWLQSRQPHYLEQGAPLAGSRTRGASRVALVIACAVLVIPYFAVFSPSTFRAFGRFVVDPELSAPVGAALKLSLILASLTALGSAITASAAVAFVSGFASPRLRAVVSSVLALPGGVSVLVLGLGVWLAYGRWLDPFEGDLAPMLALQIAIFFPLSFRILWPVAQGTQRGLLEAAATLGASPMRAFFHVEWPRWRGPWFAIITVVLAAALGEVAAVSLFYSERLIPLPLLISRLAGQYRFEEAQALAALLFMLSGLAAIVALMGRDWIGNIENRFTR